MFKLTFIAVTREEITNIASDSHLFSFQHNSYLLMMFVILIPCLKINDICIGSTHQLQANKLNFGVL